MNAKEKAKELVDNFYQLFPLEMDVTVTEGDLSWEYDGWKQSKQCALIAVDEMLKPEKIIVSHKTSAYKSFEDFNQNLKHIQNELDSYVLSRYSYWQEVKQEITQL